MVIFILHIITIIILVLCFWVLFFPRNPWYFLASVFVYITIINVIGMLDISKYSLNVLGFFIMAVGLLILLIRTKMYR